MFYIHHGIVKLEQLLGIGCSPYSNPSDHSNITSNQELKEPISCVGEELLTSTQNMLLNC